MLKTKFWHAENFVFLRFAFGEAIENLFYSSCANSWIALKFSTINFALAFPNWNGNWSVSFFFNIIILFPLNSPYSTTILSPIFVFIIVLVTICNKIFLRINNTLLKLVVVLGMSKEGFFS
jgi:hypothetical protein